MGTLHILYADIEDELTMYVTTSLIHKVVPNNLAPYYITLFFIEFNITNANIRSNLSFDQMKVKTIVQKNYIITIGNLHKWKKCWCLKH
jgi:hypothetical protein